MMVHFLGLAIKGVMACAEQGLMMILTVPYLHGTKGQKLISRFQTIFKIGQTSSI
ncbi:MAG: hypothetical protein ACI8XB_003035 [Patiriisocius sp.]|jgi:hypothetical protein